MRSHSRPRHRSEASYIEGPIPEITPTNFRVTSIELQLCIMVSFEDDRHSVRQFPPDPNGAKISQYIDKFDA